MDSDRIIDAALESYLAGEPRAGLEARIFAMVRAKVRRRRTVRNRMLAAIPVAAITAALIAIAVQTPSPRPPVETARVVSTESVPVRVVTPAKSRRALAPIPAPRTLSGPETALARLAWDEPEQAVALLSDTREPEMKPIEIELISIAPIDIAELE